MSHLYWLLSIFTAYIDEYGQLNLLRHNAYILCTPTFTNSQNTIYPSYLCIKLGVVLLQQKARQLTHVLQIYLIVLGMCGCCSKLFLKQNVAMVLGNATIYHSPKHDFFQAKENPNGTFLQVCPCD